MEGEIITGWTANAWESISGVSWFYKTWFEKGMLLLVRIVAILHGYPTLKWQTFYNAYLCGLVVVKQLVTLVCFCGCVCLLGTECKSVQYGRTCLFGI
jgi:hypothetical protein